MAPKKGKRASAKPTPLTPNEDAQDEAILEAFNPAALEDEDDPDVAAARLELAEAEQKLRQSMSRQAMKKLAAQGAALDPDKVEELCEKERWKKGELTALSLKYFGFVPEKFEALAKTKPEGSPERARLMEARDKAREIYTKQIKADIKAVSSRIESENLSKTKKREQYESVSRALWSFYKNAQLENSLVYKFQGKRVLWAAHVVGETFEWHNGRSNGSGRGYQQWKITPKG